MRRYVTIIFSLLFGVVYIHRRVAMYLCFFNPLLGVILWPRATTVRRRKSKNPRRTRRKSKPAAFRPALPISLKTSPISQARYNGPFLFLRGMPRMTAMNTAKTIYRFARHSHGVPLTEPAALSATVRRILGSYWKCVHCRGNLPRAALHAPLLPRFLHLIDHCLGHAFHGHLFSVRQLLADLRNFGAGSGEINPS